MGEAHLTPKCSVPMVLGTSSIPGIVLDTGKYSNKIVRPQSSFLPSRSLKFSGGRQKTKKIISGNPAFPETYSRCSMQKRSMVNKFSYTVYSESLLKIVILTSKHMLKALKSPAINKSSINQACLTIEPLFA